MGELRLLTLREAAASLGGGLCASSLRREIGRGRLTAHRVAGRLLVTEVDLRNMVERCRVDVSQSRRGYTSDLAEAESRRGPFSTDQLNAGLAAAKATAKALKKPSPITSDENTGLPPGLVILLK